MWLNNILPTELVLILLYASLIAVIMYNVTDSLTKNNFKSVVDVTFLIFLVLTQLLKEFLYEKIRNTFNNLHVISFHIFLFELAISFSTFTSIYAAINGGKLPFSKETK